MPSRADIQKQQELLNIQRNTLAGYLHQLALHTTAYAPPSVFNGIHEARSQIRTIKACLLSWGVKVDEHPDDEPAPGGVDLPPFVQDTSSKRPVYGYIDRLIRELQHDPQCKPIKSKLFNADFIGVRETLLTVDAIALIKADTLTEAEITALHYSYFDLLAAWRPSSFLKRGLKKNGLLCFVFEDGCTAEDILFILRQKRDSNPVIDAALVMSWVLDFDSMQLYTHDLLVASFPPVITFPGLVYPGKRFLENFIRECASEREQYQAE